MGTGVASTQLSPTSARPLKSAQGVVGLRSRALRSRIDLLLGRSPRPPTPASDLSGLRPGGSMTAQNGTEITEVEREIRACRNGRSSPKRCSALGEETGGEELVKPHGRLVQLGFTCRHASTCCLSTYSSRTALQRPEGLGVFILEGASHLDAFSGYPVPT